MARHEKKCKGRATNKPVSVVSGQPPWEGEAPAEPKSTVGLQLSLLADNKR